MPTPEIWMMTGGKHTAKNDKRWARIVWTSVSLRRISTLVWINYAFRCFHKRRVDTVECHWGFERGTDKSKWEWLTADFLLLSGRKSHIPTHHVSVANCFSSTIMSLTSQKLGARRTDFFSKKLCTSKNSLSEKTSFCILSLFHCQSCDVDGLNYNQSGRTLLCQSALSSENE